MIFISTLYVSRFPAPAGRCVIFAKSADIFVKNPSRTLAISARVCYSLLCQPEYTRREEALSWPEPFL